MVAEINGVSSAALDDALRLLREDTERHAQKPEREGCVECLRHWPCPAIVTRAQVYAPDALADLVVKAWLYEANQGDGIMEEHAPILEAWRATRG